MKSYLRTGFCFFLWVMLTFSLPNPGAAKGEFSLTPVDKVVVLELHGDNNYPVGKSDALVSRLGDIRYTGKQYPPLGARGMGLLVEITLAGKKRTILFDAGSRGEVLQNNFAYFGKNPADIEAIVISHGHSDHFGGLPEALRMIQAKGGNRKMSVYVGSETAFETRYFCQPDGDLKGPWTWPREAVEQLGASHIIGGPYLLLDGMALYTGPIPYSTPYENINMANQKGWCIKDDSGNAKLIDMPEESALVLNVRNRGLVVISGCTHRGVVNTLRYAKQLTGIDSIYARFGSYPKEDNAKLMEDLLTIKPAIFIGAHCSPNKPELMHALRTNLPEHGILYYQSVIGSEFNFSSTDN